MSYDVEIAGGDEENGYRNTLRIVIKDKVTEYCDKGEPEDNSFFRDYYWIMDELIRAYQQGREDMHKELEL